MKQIIVIEDELDVREIILDILDAENFSVLGAENGQEGIQLVQETLPDLVICDVMMPELNGYDVLAALRENQATATIPFIFLTAKSTKSDLRQGMDSGADDYLTKPFTRKELLNAISSRIQKQEVIEQKNQDQLNKLRSNITFALPHELRTPLNGIISFSTILLEELSELPTEEVQEMLTDIQYSAQRLNRIICNFLLYADLELLAHDPERRKKLPLGSIPSPSILVKYVIDRASQASPERAQDVCLDLCSDIEIKVSEDFLKKIVEELVDNAIKFSIPGQKVYLKTQLSNQYYCLKVIDQGRGMTVEQVTNIGAYQQFDRKQYEQQGSGLGLAIIKQLIELQSGELSIESVPEKGTTVSVFLPIVV
ncbi:MAG: hybrid sensor histidine kinase/response regulator [Microcoleaceae cyanobacterium]